jgi:hypothetical protein
MAPMLTGKQPPEREASGSGKFYEKPSYSNNKSLAIRKWALLSSRNVNEISSSIYSCKEWLQGSAIHRVAQLYFQSKIPGLGQ